MSQVVAELRRSSIQAAPNLSAPFPCPDATGQPLGLRSVTAIGPRGSLAWTGTRGPASEEFQCHMCIHGIGHEALVQVK